MRHLPPVVLLVVSIAVVGCSSGAAPTAAPESAAPSQASAAPEPSVATPAPPASASAETSAAASAQPSVDNSVFGSQYAQIQSDLQAAMSKITASMMTAKSPEDLAAAYQQFVDAMRKSIAASRAIDWPPAIAGDMDKLLADEDELVGIWEKMIKDPTATAGQERMAAIEAEMPALAQRIAAAFGVQIAP